MKKTLEKIAYRHSINQVFDDFLNMTVCAFSLGRMEDEYLNIAKRYTPEEMQLFAEALAKMVLLYDNKSSLCGSCTASQCLQYVADKKSDSPIEPTFEKIKPRLLAAPVPIGETLQLSLF